jgi:predicted transcriptional regulator
MKKLNEAREKILSDILSVVRENPGIRPSEINRKMGREHSAHYRNALIKQGIIRKERKGSKVHYYPV